MLHQAIGGGVLGELPEDGRYTTCSSTARAGLELPPHRARDRHPARDDRALRPRPRFKTGQQRDHRLASKSGQRDHRLRGATGDRDPRSSQRGGAVSGEHRGRRGQGPDGPAHMAGPAGGVRLRPRLPVGHALRTQAAAPATGAGRRHGAPARPGSAGRLLPGTADLGQPQPAVEESVDLPHDAVVFQTWL
jgi:hypothetical protein